MLRESEFYCPECDDGSEATNIESRRQFMRKSFGVGAAAIVGVNALSTRLLAQETKAARPAGPAEDLVRELYSGLSADQKKELVYAWDYAPRAGATPSRLATYNAPAFGKRLGESYTKPQQDLVRRTLRATLASDESLERISRDGKWDSSGSFEGCGAVIFGDPTSGEKFTWLFAGHHLTLRCDGNSEPGAAFGGPLYYGHSANGYADTNAYVYQTNKVHEVFDALDADQRKAAVTDKNPGDGQPAIRFRPEDEPRPGVAYSDLKADQQKLVGEVMRTLISPFRKEDADEVMALIKVNGGMEKIHLAFFREGEQIEGRQRWTCWRLEGPGFVWNYRVLPHVHCFVRINTVA
ncbi:MAG: DUF3500 domain-containing protein [Planctomycetaceae bacterium]